MKLFTTNLGIAREAADGTLEVLDLAEPDLGALLSVDPELKRAKSADVLKRARGRDVLFVISTDAHDTRELSNSVWGVHNARRGWVDPDQIANFRLRDF